MKGKGKELSTNVKKAEMMDDSGCCASIKSGKTAERILVAIDNTDASQKAVSYVAKLATLLSPCEITLFHVLPSVPPNMLEDGGSEDPDVERELKEERDDEIEEWEEDLKNQVKKVFEDAKKKLMSSGIPAEHIKTKLTTRSSDIAHDIVDAAHKGGYSTVVVGRRGISMLKELALGSISYKVVKLAKDCTVWVVH